LVALENVPSIAIEAPGTSSVFEVNAVSGFIGAVEINVSNLNKILQKSGLISVSLCPVGKSSFTGRIDRPWGHAGEEIRSIWIIGHGHVSNTIGDVVVEIIKILCRSYLVAEIQGFLKARPGSGVCFKLWNFKEGLFNTFSA